jgi:hypothetical protein
MQRYQAADPRAGIETRLAANSILAELKDLPEAQREVLLMLKAAGMTIDEVARIPKPIRPQSLGIHLNLFRCYAPAVPG